MEVTNGSTVNTLRVPDSLYVTNLHSPLLSVSKLDRAGMTVMFGNAKAQIFAKDGKLICVAPLIKNLYQLHVLPTPATALRVSTNEGNSALLWHLKLGHLSNGNLHKLATSKAIKGMPLELEGEVGLCESCLQGKQKKQPFPARSRTATEKLELVHSDLVGPLGKRSRGGAQYLLTIVDDFTRYTWVILLRLKSEVPKALTEWAIREQNQQEKRLKVLRTDRGREFVNSTMEGWCKREGVVHQRTIQHNPQQNGVAERHNGLIFEIVRCQLAWSGMPLTWWGEAAITAADIINHWPRSALGNGTPNYRWHGVRRDAQELHAFGCVGHVRVDVVNRRDPKLGSRSRRCAHLGRADVSKGWRLYDPATQKIIHSRDVVFEDTVPFYARVPPPEVQTVDREPDGTSMEKALEELPPVEEVAEPDEEEISDEEPEEEGAPAEPGPRPVEREQEPRQPREQSPVLERRRGRPTKAESTRRWLEAAGGQSRRALRLQGEDDPSRALVLFELQEAALAAEAVPDYSDLPMPRSFKEAMKRPDAAQWKEATDKEVACIHKNDTYDLVSREDLPGNANILGNTWVFKVKTGGLHRARLCVRGDWQIEGVDFFEIFAPTARL